MIVVEVRLSVALREFLGFAQSGALQVELTDPATLPDLYRWLNLVPEMVAFCTVNNRYPGADYRLQTGDKLRIVARSVGG